MKINKLIKALSLLLVVAFAACADFEDTIIDSPQKAAGNQGVFFPKTNAQAFELEPTDPTQMTLTIARDVSSGAVQVPITVDNNDDNVFVVPASVNFADGETEVEFVVTFPEAGEGTTYNLALSVSGDDVVNPYGSEVPNLSVNVTRIKWNPVEAPMIYIDGTFQGAGWSDPTRPMYVQAEKAELASVVRYRFKNVYKPATGAADEHGIYDGYYTLDPGFDASRDWYTVIEVNSKGETGAVSMFRHEIGVTRGDYGMSIIGSNGTNRGALADSLITFAAGALAFWDNDGGYTANQTLIYLSKEVFIAANLKIDDFNDVEYEAIDGGLSVYESAAYEEAWERTLSKAIDMDEKNDESDYKNLFYISDLYADDLGLAFYNFDGVIRIPEAQPTGIQFLGNDVYVSQSTNHSSSIRTNYKGVDIYTFGLLFHYEDGTVVGDFAETFYYSEDALEYTKDDFLGSFTLFGGSSSMDVEITESDNSNFAITGITYVEEVIATFDPAEPKMTIAAQKIADIVLDDDTYEATWYTNTPAGASGSATLEFAFNLRGDLVITDSSVGIGYRILVENVADEDDAGWLTTVNNLVFVVPDAEEEQVLTEATLQKNASATTRSAGSGPNFSVQGKMDVNNSSKLVRSQSARRIN